MQDMDLDSVDVAAYITKQCAINKFYIDITKLQKVLFACYGAFLAIGGNRLCSEHPQAWPQGPIFLPVYKFSLKHVDFIQDLLKRKESVAASVDSKMLELMNYTIRFFTQYMSGELVRWSRQPGSPWDRTTDHGNYMGCEIPDEFIADYFKSVLSKTDEQPA